MIAAHNDKGPELWPQRLDEGRLRQAYPLARLANKNLTLEAWLRFARPLTRAGLTRGFFIVTTAQDHLLALCRYSQEENLSQNANLLADQVVIPSFPCRDQALTALIDGLEKTARDLGCTTVTLWLPQSSARLIGGRLERALHVSGMSAEEVAFRKRLV